MNTVLIEDAPTIKNVKVGDILKIQEEDEDGNKKTVSYEVTNVYKYIVRAISRKRHAPRYFGYGDLVMMGLEWQGAGNEVIPKKARHNRPKKG